MEYPGSFVGNVNDAFYVAESSNAYLEYRIPLPDSTGATDSEVLTAMDTYVKTLVGYMAGTGKTLTRTLEGSSSDGGTSVTLP